MDANRFVLKLTDFVVSYRPDIKKKLCSTQLSLKFFLLMNVKMPIIVGILTFMSGKNSILGVSEPIKAEFIDIFILTSI